MNILNMMPASVRTALRRFYLERELVQIDQNEQHLISSRDAYQAEIDKAAARRGAVVRELMGLPV